MITSFHGIGAYHGQRNPVALRNQLRTCLAGVEICVADRPVGAFGGVFCGDMTYLFDRDVWSYVVDGQRYTDAEGALLHGEDDATIDQAGYESLCQTAADPYYKGGYCEGWLKSVALRALWVKDYAPEATKKAARILALHRGVPLITVTGKTRIWDLLDNNQLPFYWEQQA